MKNLASQEKQKKRKFMKLGMTLVEMLIAMFIFIMIMGGSVFLLSQIYKNYGFAMEQGLAVNAVQNGLDNIIQDIRGTKQSDGGSYPIQSANDSTFVFFADIDKDGATEKVHYFLENNEIKRGVSEPSGTPPSYPPGDETVIVIAEDIVNSSEQPLFYYFDTNYPIDQTNNPLSTPVTPVADIRLVKVDIFINIYPYHSPDNVRLESYVEMRNLKDNW